MELHDTGQNSSGGAQIAALVVEARKLNDGLRALFLPQQGRRPRVRGPRIHLRGRTARRSIAPATLTFAPACACGRRTIDGLAVEIVGLFVSSLDELAAGGRLQRGEAVSKMARVQGLNTRRSRRFSSSRRTAWRRSSRKATSGRQETGQTGAAGRSGSEQLTSDAPYTPETAAFGAQPNG